MIDQTDETEHIARSYFEAWTSHDSERASALLADDFRFTAGDMAIEGKEAFLDAGAFPEDATVTLEAEAYQGELGFQMYLAGRGDKSIRIVEQLLIRGGLVRESNFVTDMSAFVALSSG